MVQTVIFDLDGTLLNTIGDLSDAGNWVCRENDWPIHTEDAIKLMVGNGIPKLVERFSPEDARTPERLAKTLEQFTARYDAHKMDRTGPYPGVRELLSRLQAAGLRLAVLSNKADDLCPPLVGHYFGNVFDTVQGKLPGVPAKPDPAGVYLLMEKLKADPETTVFIGDSNVDIRTGRNAGLTSIGVLWGFRGREELSSAGARFLASTAEQLGDLLLSGEIGVDRPGEIG